MNKQHHQHQTIGATAVALMREYRRAETATVIRAVRAKFPKSRFNADQAAHYRSLFQRGMFGKGRRAVKH